METQAAGGTGQGVSSPIEGKGGRGVRRKRAAWVTGLRTGGLAGREQDAGWTPLPEKGLEEARGAGWNRMTVAMPRDHAGAFHGNCTYAGDNSVFD